MQSLQTWLGGGAPDKEPPSGASVLSEWNKYSSGGAAPIATAAPASGAALAAAEEGTSSGEWLAAWVVHLAVNLVVACWALLSAVGSHAAAVP
jgi:hypothetical protein